MKPPANKSIRLPVRIGPVPSEIVDAAGTCIARASRDLHFTKRPQVAHAIATALNSYEGLRKALTDCQDFLWAIEDATEGAGQIDKDSIMRPSERLKTTARKLNQKAKAALAKAGK